MEKMEKRQKTPKEVANLLEKQYVSVISIPCAEMIVHDPQSFFADHTNDPQKLCQIDITESDISDATEAIGNHAAAGPDGFHAQLLKCCKRKLAKPLQILWSSLLCDDLG